MMNMAAIEMVYDVSLVEDSSRQQTRRTAVHSLQQKSFSIRENVGCHTGQLLNMPVWPG